MRICGISSDFSLLSPCMRQVTHALLTRPPLASGASSLRPFDLHVLSTPPAFILSQDQTLCKSLFPLKTTVWLSLVFTVFRTSFLNDCKEFSRIVCVSLFSYQGSLLHSNFCILSLRFWSVKNFFQVFQIFFEAMSSRWRLGHSVMFSVSCQLLFSIFWKQFELFNYLTQFIWRLD